MKTLAILAMIASASTAYAGGSSYDVSGTTVGKAENTYVPMGETHLFIDVNSTYTMPDNGTPMDGMVGDCLGSLQVAMGAGATGMGTCVWTDDDGDSWFGPWNVSGMTPDRATSGTWYVSGGTGKFATASGGGTFTSLTNPETGESKLDVFGSVVVK